MEHKFQLHLLLNLLLWLALTSSSFSSTASSPCSQGGVCDNTQVAAGTGAANLKVPSLDHILQLMGRHDDKKEAMVCTQPLQKPKQNKRPNARQIQFSFRAESIFFFGWVWVNNISEFQSTKKTVQLTICALVYQHFFYEVSQPSFILSRGVLTTSSYSITVISSTQKLEDLLLLVVVNCLLDTLRKSRARDATLNAVQSPLLDIGVERATGIVWNMTGGSDLTLFEATDGSSGISDQASPRTHQRSSFGSHEMQPSNRGNKII